MPRGRPVTADVKNNKGYFAEYYHKTNSEYTCICGCKYKLHSKRRHLLSKKHLDLIEFLKVKAELEQLKEQI